MIKKIIINILLFFLIGYSLISQNEANNWFFGAYCGMTFNASDKSPSFVPGSQMNTDEGCATYSDSNGDLLFYTDGKQVWNRKHIQMPNGYDLNGHESSTQSAVIIAKPGSVSEFYIFTVDRQGGTFGMSYSIVDMRLESGLGDIIDKNNYLHFPVAEKITAVKHSNGRDIWIITHEWGSDKFLSYLLTSSGIANFPVISSVGTAHKGDNMNAVGYMKASPDGEYIAVAIYWDGIFEVLRFDDITGLVSSPITFQSSEYQTVYGVEFSSDASKVYFSTSRDKSSIYQIDMKAGNDEEIKNSITTIADSYSSYNYQALQIAPDSKIYIAKRNKTYLSAIEQPNEKGVNCRFKENAFSLVGRKSNAGLPTFNQSFLDLYINIIGENEYCEDDTLRLSCTEYDDAQYQWEGPNNFTSSDREIQLNNVTLINSGYYKVTVKLDDKVKSDSVYITIYAKPIAKIYPSGNVYVCEGQSIELISETPGENLSYFWSTGEITESIIISEQGRYFLIVTNENECSDTAFVTVLAASKPVVEIIPVSGYPKLCPGEIIELSTKEKYISYKWSTGSTDSTISIEYPGLYYLEVIDEKGCRGRDSILIDNYDVSISNIPDADFGNIIVGSELTKRFDFINLGKDSIYISSISKILNIKEFKLKYQPSLPIWLKTNEKISIEVTFNPSSEGFFLDSVGIIAAFPCNVYEYFQIIGTSGSELSEIWIPDTTATIGDNQFEIPIYGNLTNRDSLRLSFKAEVRFDAAIFYPDTGQSIIVSNKIEKGIRILSLDVQDIWVTNQESILASIRGIVLLSNGIYPLDILDFSWNSPYVKVKTKSGSLIAKGVCKSNISKIVLSNSQNLSVYPNPATNNFTIKSNFDSFIINKAVFYDLYGRKVKIYQSDEIVKTEKGGIFNLNALVAGQYLLILDTNIGEKLVFLTIIK